ncbi:MAG: hypothetical protein D3914_16980 [Candidatus Electrothrix sp. LOE2]|nr:hypothetical protein [Candidatus Electrothrix sp. LOE2]
MSFHTADAADPKTFRDHGETFEDFFFIRAATVENSAPCLRKSFTAPPALITPAPGAGVTEFYNIVSALLYLFIIRTNGIRTKSTNLCKFSHHFLLSAVTISYTER